MRPFISLCMIVKNEEKVIERCLSSVVNLVDEIIVIDTGSIDRTKELVLKYTSKVFDFEWINDFSAARNYAASLAVGEWILVLDADEYVDEENFKEFILKLKKDNGKYNVYTVNIINFTGDLGETLVQSFHDRVYRNNDTVSYHRKIHEQLKINLGKLLKRETSNLVIYHSGYLENTFVEKEKSKRNRELLNKEMNAENNKAFDLFNLGNEYYSIGEYEEALDSYLESYKLKSDFQLVWVSNTLIQIVICLIKLKKYNDALNIILDAEQIYTNSPEFPYLKGEILYLRGQLEDAKKEFQKIIDNNKQYNNIIIRPDFKDQGPHFSLGGIYLFQEDYSRAIYHYISVLNINKYNVESIKRVVVILNKFHSEGEIAEFLFSKELANQKNINSYVNACFEVGNPKLALKLLNKFPDVNKLLNQITLLKRLDTQVLKKLIELEWINIIDLLLLREYGNKGNNLKMILKPFEQINQYKMLIDLVNRQTSIDKFDEDLIVFSLKTLLSYKKYSLSRLFLEDIETVDVNVISKVAGILYSYGFKVDALQLYDKCDWSYFKEQDFINIINSLLETNNENDAIQLAIYAASTFKNDFRFYKYILEYTTDEKLYKSTIIEAKRLFANSLYLKNYV
mgnify:CR=1 FL=1